MNKQTLFLNIFQVSSDLCEKAAIPPHTDFDLNLQVHVARNSKNASISYITLEFAGVRSRFLCSILFNGSGDHDTCLANFSMPKRKIQSHQKAVALLSCLQFLVHNKVINASWADFCASVTADYYGPNSVIADFDRITFKSREYIQEHPELMRGSPAIATSQNFTF